MTITPKSEFKPTKQIPLGKKRKTCINSLIIKTSWVSKCSSVDYVRQSLKYISTKWRKVCNQFIQ